MRRLLILNILLLVLSVMGFLQAAAKDETSLVEAIVFWTSVFAFPVLTISLLALAGTILWRSSRRAGEWKSEAARDRRER
jgi:hypothetical protein